MVYFRRDTVFGRYGNVGIKFVSRGFGRLNPKSCYSSRKNILRITKTVLLVWIACVSTFLGIIVPFYISEQSSRQTTELYYLQRGLQVPTELQGNRTLLQTKLAEKKRVIKEQEYYIPRPRRVNPMDYEFLLLGKSVCDQSSPFLLITVPSIPGHFKQRDAIRRTYGSFAENNVYDSDVKQRLNVSVRLVFILGNAKSKSKLSLIQNENKIYKDIVQADFTDSYYNLTIKMILTLKWVSEYCPGARYLLKIDEDIFVNLPHLVEFLRVQKYYPEGSIYGKIHESHEVMRTGRWAVSKAEFPLIYYPPYAAGNSYVISGNIIPKLFHYSEYFPYLSIEDAFITGCLATVLGVRRFNTLGFTWWDQTLPPACGFYDRKQFTGNRVSVQDMYKLWAAYVSYRKYCRRYRPIFRERNVDFKDILSVINKREENRTTANVTQWDFKTTISTHKSSS